MASNVRIIRLPCTGRIDPMFIVKAFEGGADGVIVSGCHPADCHYTTGNYHARRRFTVFHELAGFLGIDPGRITFSWVSASEGAKWRDVVDETVARRAGAGPVQRVPRARRPAQHVRRVIRHAGRAVRRRAAAAPRRARPAQKARPPSRTPPSQTRASHEGAARPGSLPAVQRRSARRARLGGRPPRRPAGVHHLAGRRRPSHLRHTLRAQPGDLLEPPPAAGDRVRQGRPGRQGLRREGRRGPAARGAAHPGPHRADRRALRWRARGARPPRRRRLSQRRPSRRAATAATTASPGSSTTSSASRSPSRRRRR